MNEINNSRDTILQCALKLFSEKGYEAVGITEITESASITKPTLYYFFQSKEGLFKAILDEYYNKFNTLLESASCYEPNLAVYEKDVFPVLKKLTNTYFSFAKDNKIFYLMLLSLYFAPPTAQTTILAMPYIRKQYDIVLKLFCDISSKHHNLKNKEFEHACNFIAIINSSIGFWYQGIGEIDDKKAKRLVHQFMHGIFS